MGGYVGIWTRTLIGVRRCAKLETDEVFVLPKYWDNDALVR